MRATPTPPDPRECAAIGDLLAWYANGTLGAVDRAAVDSHTGRCESCRATLAIERRIVETMRAPRDNVEQSPHAGWQKLAARLDAEVSAKRTDDAAETHAPMAAPAAANASKDAAAGRGGRNRVNWPAALGAAVAVQAAAIAVLAVALVRHRQVEEAPRFHTLSSADPTLAANGPLVRIAFDPSVDEAMARSIAGQESAKILAGPSPDNVYTFVFVAGMDAADSLDRKVSELRRQAHVLLVEPVVVGDSRREQ